MRHYHLNHHERVATGFTDLFVLRKTDFVSAVAGAREAVVLMPLVLGDVMMNTWLLEVRTNAAGVTQALGQFGIGVGPSHDQFVTNANLLAAGSEYFGATANSVPYLQMSAAAVNLTFSITPDAAETTAAMTAGEFWIWASISHKSERNLQA